MKPLPHLYEVTLFSTPKGYATLLTDGVPELRSAPPRDFGGPGDAWSPEHLLLASVETCFVLTFRAVAEASKFDFLSLEVSGSGTVDRKDGGTRFIDIVLRSRLALPKGADPERAKRMLEKGQKRLPCHCVTFGSRSFGKRNRGRVPLGVQKLNSY